MYSSLKMYDFDGTLFHTSDALYLAYSRAFEIVAGKTLNRETWDLFFGAHISKLGEHLNLSNEQIVEVRNVKYDIYPREYVDHIKPILPVIETTEYRGDSVIVSNTDTEVTTWILDYFGYRDRFVKVYGPDVAPRRKPSPMPYLVVGLNHLPQWDSYVIFEDSEFGLKAARDASTILNAMTRKPAFVVRVEGEKMIWE